ncbi:SOS response-associated peptidase [Sphingomonas asaccharolytica]|uniref:SOS response-associated peptidase n=1 Tax=Sphingomonas asaccharolytica TaxID=40681 RepID=UPI00082F4885|nr:SOS response-associated peptidase [Sphingomonas asaccharolytica]
MCNDYRQEVEIASIMEDFDDLEINIETPEGVPEDAPRADIKMTDVAPIVRTANRDPGNRRAVGELVNRRWSWPGARGKPVYNFRSESRAFTSGRCLIVADGFYEFTDPLPGEKRKTKWLFTLKDHPWFCIAGIWRAHPEVGEAFTMLTMDAGEDIAPYHHRQIVPLAPEQWAAWLDPTVPAKEVLRYLPAGSLPAVRVYPPAQPEAA